MAIVGTGVDITEVTRIRRAIEKWGDDFLNRVFTCDELENAKKRGSLPRSSSINNEPIRRKEKQGLYQHLAGRFAAKEAVFKALGNTMLNWKDIQILNDSEGKPIAEILNNKTKKTTVHISISHVKNYATAFAIITKES